MERLSKVLKDKILAVSPRVRCFLEQLPCVGRPAVLLGRKAVHRLRGFEGSREYWEERYRRGGTSGCGSYGKLAEFKAEVLNRFVEEHGIESVVELGCGDGNQLTLARYPHYLGFDISPTAIELCRKRFASDPTKQFRLYDPARFEPEVLGNFDLVLSLDVLFHLVEDAVYETYMRHLFSIPAKYVAVYSSNHEEQQRQPPHVRHRQFTNWIEGKAVNARLLQTIPNRYPMSKVADGSFADFYIYELSSV